MKGAMQYQNYYGSVEFSEEDGLLFGKVMGIRSLISYEGESVHELEEDFKTAVNVYLNHCKERGMEPERPYKGSFNVRISSELHASAASAAQRIGKSLNAFVQDAIAHEVMRS